MRYKQLERDFLSKLGLRLRQLRQARGWSQEQLALRCGLHRTYVGAVERGERNVSVVNLLKLATSLGVPIYDLFMGLERSINPNVEKEPT